MKEDFVLDIPIGEYDVPYRQKQYLSFNGDYSTLGKNDMPDGKSHLSDSLPVNLAWNFTPASGKTVSKYSVTFGQKSDLSDGYEVVGSTAKSVDLYNVYLGTNYFKICACLYNRFCYFCLTSYH